MACNESTAPKGELAEVYRLVEVAGDPLPATIEEALNWITEGGLVRDGDGAVLSFDCNDTGLCLAPDRLRFVPGGAVIEREITADSVLVWRYEVGATTAFP